MRQHDTLRQDILHFVITSFPLAKLRKLNHDDPLVESGIVDSLGVLTLVHYLEAELGLEVKDEDLVPENFQTVDSLAAFARRKLTGTDINGHHRTPSQS